MQPARVAVPVCKVLAAVISDLAVFQAVAVLVAPLAVVVVPVDLVAVVRPVVVLVVVVALVPRGRPNLPAHQYQYCRT